jgi:biopolymer transport protein ExbB/biopolymer transport protein TolQ
MDMSLLGLWNQMGSFAKGIVIVMALMSIYSLTIMVSKWWGLRKAQKETIKFAPEFSQFLEEDNLTEAIKLAESYKKSHVALVLGGALGEVKPLIQDGSVTVADINSAERAVERNMLLEITSLKRGLAVLATVGATAPFVGLLGTTMGIINAFTGMAASGSGGLASIGGGIAEALATTAFGLLVAIPAVWLYNYFINRIDYISMEITYATKEFVDFLLRYEARLHKTSGKSSEAISTLMESTTSDQAALARSRMS